MKSSKKVRIIPLLLILLFVVMMIVPASVLAAAEPTVNLGSASSFAVLAGSTITNTGTTTIIGDIGLSPGNAYTGKASVTHTGTEQITTAAATAAQVALGTAITDAAGRLTASTIPSELGGQTLTPGVYTSADGTFQITGTLKLDIQGDPNSVFIFQTASTLTTLSGSSVELINGTEACQIFWQVGSAATLGTNSTFIGNILAEDAITATTGAKVKGKLLAHTGAVTLDTNTIENVICSGIALPLIKIKKTASPLALSGGGLVTYTYEVTNPSTLPLNTVGVTDDKIATITYVSGDINSDNLLQPGEKWIYTGSMNLTNTTTNTATATGTSGTITVTDNAVATVVVTPVVVPPVVVPPTTPVNPPLINVVKTPDPLALKEEGTVTYTYKVTNPGKVALSNINLTDDKISTLTYVSGDINGDKLLQPNETWIYTSNMKLSETTTNTVTAKGTAYGITAVDIAFATVVVAPIPIEPPLINIIKIPDPLALAGEGTVTYTYKVTNPGTVPLSNVKVTDDKINSVTYVSGDVNGDKLLQPYETWIYTGKMNLKNTTTNIATAEGTGNDIVAIDHAFATVIVTVPGEELPNTYTNWYNALLIGVALMLIGSVTLVSRKRFK